MDTTESITFTSKLTFWDKFKCFYLLHLYSLIFFNTISKEVAKDSYLSVVYQCLWLFTCDSCCFLSFCHH